MLSKIKRTKKNKKIKNNYLESNLLTIEENINKLNLLEKEKDKKIFALKRNIQEVQDKKNKFIGKTFKSIEDIDDLRIVCKELDELDLLESIERTLKNLKNDLIKSGVEPIKSIEEIIESVDNNELIKSEKQRHKGKFKKKRKKINKNLITIVAAIIILSGSAITLNIYKDKKEEPKEDMSHQSSKLEYSDEEKKSITPVNKDGYYRYEDSEGNIFIPEDYEKVEKFSEDLAQVKINEKWGYIDNTGKIVIEANYDEVNQFSEGFAAVKINEKWGYINTDGKEIIKVQFDKANNFSKGYASVKLDGKEIKIDKYGEEVNNTKPKNKETDNNSVTSEEKSSKYPKK